MIEKVAVLMGGMSSEREVSLVSGGAVAEALKEQGYHVTMIDATRELWTQLIKADPDIIFNALHGEWGEDGRAQGILDLYGKPYTHSGVMTSALAMDKHRAKIILMDVGINVSKGMLIDREIAARRHVMDPPYVVKPNAQGSSVGVYVVVEGANRPPLDMAMNKKMGDEVLVEEFAPGRELTVAVLNGKALCVTEIVAQTSFYDYEAKYADGGSVHIVPAEIPVEITDICKNWAEKAHDVLGCRGLTRSDFRFDDEKYEKNSAKAVLVNKIVMLELNTQPGMTPTSLAPEQAQHLGMNFGQLCRWIVEDASWPR